MTTYLRLFLVLGLLAGGGCAGHQAMQWRVPQPEKKPVQICETRGMDRECEPATYEDVRQVLDVLNEWRNR